MLKKPAYFCFGFIFFICVSIGFSNENALNLDTHIFQISQEHSVRTKSLSTTSPQKCTIHFSLNPDLCRLETSDSGYDFIEFEGAQLHCQPNYPLVPMQTLQATLPGNAKITGARIQAGNYREINKLLKLMPAPPLENCSRNFQPNQCEIDQSDEFYPGSWISFDAGSDSRKTQVFVRIYPLQIKPRSQKAILLTDATVEIFYEPDISKSIQKSQDAFENLILCSETLQPAAEALKSIHDSLGVSSFIQTVEFIDKNYKPAAACNYKGYETEKPVQLESYNYELANKIRNYLLGQKSNSEFKSITILGSALQVPPSYYYTHTTTDDPYPFFGPSDFLYASPEGDVVLNYQTGRLSAQNLAEAQKIVQKIRRYCGQKDFSWFNNAALAGGQMFSTEFFKGEYILQDALNKDFLQGMNIQKFYQTDGNFSRNNILSVLGKGGFGLLVQHCHGEGSRLLFEDETVISSVDILNLKSTICQLPIMVSSSCINGAFDTDLWAIPEGDPRSIGESLLLSNSGAIAYIGGSRLNWAGSVFRIDSGNLQLEKLRCVEAIMQYVLQTYHEGATCLGDLYFGSLQKFLKNNDINGPADDRIGQLLRVNEVTVFWHTLLGDPVVPIPAATKGNVTSDVPWLSTNSSYALNSDQIPVINCNNKQTITIQTKTDSKTINFKHIEYEKFYPNNDEYCIAEASVLQKNIIDTQTPYEFSFQANPAYPSLLLRASAENGKEGWFYHNLSISNVSRVESHATNAADKFELCQNYPNPFNTATQIKFNLKNAGEITLTIFNATGQEVITLADGYKSAGSHRVNWNAENAASGVYFVKLITENLTLTRKVILLK